MHSRKSSVPDMAGNNRKNTKAGRRAAGERPGTQAGSRRAAVCLTVAQSVCDRNLSRLLEGCRADRAAIRRVGRQHCAIIQCVEERGLPSCAQCAEHPCIFHENFGRICPAAYAEGEDLAWRLTALSPAPPSGTGERGRKADPQVPERCVARMRWYLAALEQFVHAGIGVVSSADIGAKVGVNSSLVRRDLCYFGQFGTPSRGYDVEPLRQGLLSVFELDRPRRMAWLGSRHLVVDGGLFDVFARHNWTVAAVFDSDPERVGARVGGHKVMNLACLGDEVRRLEIEGAVVAVEEHEVGPAVRTLVASGVSAILNLTSVPLEVPEQVVVQQADLVTQLLLLSYQARRAGGNGKGA